MSAEETIFFSEPIVFNWGNLFYTHKTKRKLKYIIRFIINNTELYENT